MKRIWEAIIRGYLRVIAPVADWMVRRRINPNTITTDGTIGPARIYFRRPFSALNLLP